MYINPFDNIPFYVGMGKGRRAYYHLQYAKLNPTPQKSEHKLNKIRKILSLNSEPIIKILFQNISKEDACECEIFLISLIGRMDLGTGTLTNQTGGGEGRFDWSEDDINKFLKVMSNPEVRKRANDSRRGQKHNEETKALFTEQRTGDKNHSYGKMWINNSEINKFVALDVWKEVYPDWLKGRLMPRDQSGKFNFN